MKHVIVRYRLKADRVAEHERLLALVFEELATHKPEGLAYRVWRLADGVSYVHQASLSGPGNPLTALGAFRAFTAEIGDRCVEPPASADATVAGSYP
ncbi:MAG: hypothetical protein HY908_20105 [Myxococcales bacterium]|nr:hypothetical protein [Myxococcales bacterium]